MAARRARTHALRAATICLVSLAGAACGDRGAKSAGSAAATAPVDGLPRLVVRPLGDGETITIDGVLDEPAWKRAELAGPFVNVSTGKPDPSLPGHGTARLTWDGRFLYVAFTVSEANIVGGFPPDAIDAHLWEKDTIEVMVDPDGDGDNRDYYEIQVSPQNLVFDSRFDDYNLPRGGDAGPFGHQDWSAGLTSAVKLDGTIDDASDRDRGYTVELEIPWRAFIKARRAPPEPGDEWRMNFYAMKDNGGASWSPILGQGNFHKASRFGRVTFAAAPRD
ncbi:MAG TPA: carbohydrate-binding family 9-like protein [Polyangiaceae bacterium]|nr:carbohydrate-binding family 9-like protein [Polyangiaceae bacterium]